MKLEFTNRFIKGFKKLDNQSQRLINQALEQMQNNLRHHSLRVKKTKDYRNPDVWEASATMGLRITFEYVKPDVLILRNCGHHDKTLDHP